MRILYTEASSGWGGQELRILVEANGMRARGHHVVMALQKGGELLSQATSQGFCVYPVSFEKKATLKLIFQLMRLIRKEKVELINTHSSWDAWIGGIVGKLLDCSVVRTRHLSTAVRKGCNSILLYKCLADQVVTTCQDSARQLRLQARLGPQRCRSVPTGINPTQLQQVTPQQIAAFREAYGIGKEEILVGTLCVLRGWKGVTHLLEAAKLLASEEEIRWMVIGSGVSEGHFLAERARLGLEEKVIFTGYLSPPYVALAALDIFLLLSWAHEGVSQASLQAGYLAKPLITTAIGGLPEVCIHEETGLQVPIHAPHAVAQAVLRLARNSSLRQTMGLKAKRLVEERFTLEEMMDQMEQIYSNAHSVHFRDR